MPSSRSQPSKDDPMFFFFMRLLLFSVSAPRRTIRCFSFSCASSFFPFQRQVDIGLRSLLGFLDEAVQQHHAYLFHTEENPRNPAAWQTAPHRPQLAAQRTNEWHADWP